jgi:HEAT repeat protein
MSVENLVNEGEPTPCDQHDGEVRRLIRELSATDERVRRRAAISLGQIKPADALPALIAALDDKFPRVVEEAALALGYLADKQALPALVRAVGHSDSGVRVAAILALGRIGPPVSVGALAAVLNDPEWRARQCAALALGEIGDNRAIPALLAVSKDPDWRVRCEVALALAKFKSVHAIEVLLELVANDYQAPNAVIVEALKTYGPSSAGPILNWLPRIEVNRRLALQVLETIGAAAVDEISSRLGEFEPGLVTELVEILGRIGSTRALKPLQALFLNQPKFLNQPNLRASTGAAIRASAGTAIAKIGGAGTAWLVTASQSDDAPLRLAAVISLSGRTQPERNALVVALEDSSLHVRAAAVKRLMESDAAHFSDRAIALLSDPSDVVRASAARALRDYKGEDANDIMLALLHDRYVDVVVAAIEALGRPENSTAVDPLAQRLKISQDDYIQTSIVEALGRIGDEKAIETLEALLEHPESVVVDTTEKVLRSLAMLSDLPPSSSALARIRERYRAHDHDAVVHHELSVPLKRLSTSVEVATFYPKEVSPGNWHSLFSYVYLKGLLQTVERDVTDRAALSIPLRRTARSAETAVARGSEIMVIPQIPGFIVNPPELRLQWLEDWHRAEFRILADPSAPDFKSEVALNGTVDYFVAGLIIGRNAISIFVTNEADFPSVAPLPERSMNSLFQTIFASYAREDLTVVERLSKAYKVLGNQLLLDVEILRSGNDWRRELSKFIEQADVFQLFWSHAAAQSANVEAEWRHALGLERSGFVRPVYWNKPMPSPPLELRGLHFAFLSTWNSMVLSEQYGGHLLVDGVCRKCGCSLGFIQKFKYSCQ